MIAEKYYNICNMTENILKKIGVTSDEAHIYQLLLLRGTQTAGQLIQLTPHSRSLTYKLLDKLIDRGYVTKNIEHGVATYTPNSPDILLQTIDDRLHTLQSTLQTLNNNLPTMRAQHILATERPTIETYEGTEELKELYEDNLRAHNKVMYFLRPCLTNGYKKIFGKWFSHFLRRQGEVGLTAYGITPDDPSGNHNPAIDKERGIRRTWVHTSDYSTQVELKSYDDRLSIVMYATKPAGVLIKNAMIAHAFQELFLLAKKGAETINVSHDHA